MSTRPFRLALALLLVVGAAARADRPPNVLVLFSDDQRADTIGALGNPHVRTPALDRLVAEGTAFTRAYCMGSDQGAVCVPSRAMLLTGRTLFRVDTKIGQDTWPEAFARMGYETFLAGKWHNGEASALRAFRQGRSIFLGGMGDPDTLPLRDIGPDRKFTAPRPAAEHAVKMFADAAIGFLGDRKGQDGPFLCYVAFNAPHDPRKAPKAYHDHFDPARIPLPANFLPVHPFDNGAMKLRDELLAPFPRTVEDTRRQLADYYAAIEHLDHQVGRILDALRVNGQAGDTVVVFASDHGLAIGSHGLFGKQSLYEHSMRAPLIFAGPGIPRGKRTEAMAYLLDIFPTLGHLAGVPGPEGSEGIDLAPAFNDPSAGRPAIFTAYAKGQRAIRDGRWKLIAYPPLNLTQLFDLDADPAETRDLAGDPRYAAEVARLTAMLRARQAEFGDDLPLTTDKPRPRAFVPPKPR
ncbi:sulfatase-like hydrolase/transferase [Tundrisphaera sp. TA3]|uniref:sulfatase-like hydrolase/transferase n=1 Tax=Tundrisphaera sp. TA3 TaxID=3435775 RepID=UPI003EBE93C1